MELLERSTPLPLTAAHPGLTLQPLHHRLTRVTRRDGALLGYVEAREVAGDGSADEQPFLAKRLRPRAQGFLEVGRFWSADEAVDALR